MVPRCLSLLVAVAPAPALACGGFFCSGQVPIEQAGEQIVFGVEGTTVTAHIRVNYQGGAEDFSWVLPLPTEPTVAVGTDALFQSLQRLTAPTFRVDWVSFPHCLERCSPEDEPVTDACCGGDDDGGTAAPSLPSSSSSVSLLAEGDAGAYEYEVVQATSGDILFDWLNDNGYDQPESARALVGHYVNLGFVFLAVRLQKNKDSGSLQPIVLKYESPDLACVPLKLTSIGATENMPVTVYVLANARAIPLNFFHAEPDLRAYPWLACANNGWWSEGEGGEACSAYGDAWGGLVSATADLANGRAFVTDFAGKTPAAELNLPAIELPLAELRMIDEPMAYLREVPDDVVNDPIVRQLMTEFMPMPEGLPSKCDDPSEYYVVSEFVFFNSDACLIMHPPAIPFDPVGMTNALDERIVQPRLAARAILAEHPYLTRLSTIISPDEMTKDPIFSFNPDLQDVPRERFVKVSAECGDVAFRGFHLEYQDGTSDFVEHETMSCAVPDLTRVPTPQIQVMHEFGPAENVLPGQLAQQETALDLRVPRPDQSSVDQRSQSHAQDKGSRSGQSTGCAMGGANPTVAMLIGLALATLRWRRRRS
ncbi:MAG: DUF2330 domain-containing protein [Myxococcales bacterium]|nr:DUF2330 domain-containing protein [Myxococcales bacterium]